MSSETRGLIIILGIFLLGFLAGYLVDHVQVAFVG